VAARLTRPQEAGSHAAVLAEAGWLLLMTAVHLIAMTSREKLHVFVDELTDKEAAATLTRLLRERERLTEWASSPEPAAPEDAWAIANAREAVREERW
jgi:hypothetical protein